MRPRIHPQRPQRLGDSQIALLIPNHETPELPENQNAGNRINCGIKILGSAAVSQTRRRLVLISRLAPASSAFKEARSGVSKLANIPVFDFFPRPGGFAQKGEAGFRGGIELKAADGDAAAHFTPTMLLDQLIDDGFQSDSMQGVTRMRGGGGHNRLCKSGGLNGSSGPGGLEVHGRADECAGLFRLG